MTRAQGQLPLWLKLAHTALVAVVVPVYWVHLGPANFLWFSDIALIVLVYALWRESRLVASTMAVAVLLPELLWNLDFLVALIWGQSPTGLTRYMFTGPDPQLVRALSGIFHVVLPLILLWLVWRLGYDRRALPLQTLLAWVILPLTFWLTDPAKNINWVRGWGNEPQSLIPAWLYLVLEMLLFPLLVYLPTHALLIKLDQRR